MVAQHHVLVEAHDREGRPVVRRMRGLFLARRPDRFRVRALGPADLTLFDVVGGPAGCQVLEAARPPPPELLAALCDDVRAAFRLGAPHGPIDVHYDELRSTDGRLQPFRIDVADRAHGYRVEIRVDRVELDVAIDEAQLMQP
jgi:hypothetical protein